MKSSWGLVNGCEANTAQNTCDANADCTWCKSAAVKSACYSLADAATLPASIFACDAKTEEEVPQVQLLTADEFKQFLRNKVATVNGCEANTAQNTCDANAACTWCKSAAVKSACYSLADATTLPASIFACDAKTEQEFSPFRQEKDIKGRHSKKNSMSAMKNFWAPVNGCESNTAQNTCDANADCTWCKSAAVKSACYSLADAATLPASIFACDAKDESFAGPQPDHHKKRHGCCVVPLILVGLIAAHMWFLHQLTKAHD